MAARKSRSRSRRKGSRRKGTRRVTRTSQGGGPNYPETRLLKLAAALIGSDWLQDEFNADPEFVITRFGLDASDRRKLYKMDLAEIAPAVRGQIRRFSEEVGRAYPKGFGDCYGFPDIRYPSPKPGVYAVEPPSKTRREVEQAGERVNLTIWGKSFCRDPIPKCKVRRIEPQPKKTWDVEVERLGGTFRCSELYVVLKPAPREQTLVAGKYQFIVNNNVYDDLERARDPDEPDFVVLP
jgi:hypothetical protein